MLKHLIPLFKEKVDKLIADVHENDSGQNIDMLDVLYVCTLDMVVDSTTGVSIDTKSQQTKDYLKSVLIGADLIATRMIKVWLHLECLYRMSSLYDFEKKSYKIIKAYLGKIIMSRKEIYDRVEGTTEQLADIDELVDGQPKTVINQLLRNWQNGTIEYKDVFDELDVLIYTGSDTSTHLAAYTLLMLAMHPDIQERVIKELKSVFISRDIPVDYDSIKQLTYLETVIKETLRLFPVIPYIGRWSGEDIKLSEWMQLVAGIIRFNSLSLQRPLLFPRARWSLCPSRRCQEILRYGGQMRKSLTRTTSCPSELTNCINTSTFRSRLDPGGYYFHLIAKVPLNITASFSYRNCIGKTYAQLSVRTIVSQILINFVPETSLTMKDIKMVLNITLRITNPNLVRLRKRTDFWEDD